LVSYPTSTEGAIQISQKKVSQKVDFEGGKEDRSIQTDENHLKGRFLPFVQHEKYG